MRKEIFYAIFVGSVLGLIIAFGVYRTNSLFKPKEASSTQKTSEKAVVSKSTSSSEFGLSIAQPENEDLVSESPITLTGVTKAGSWITISTETEDYMLQAENNGGFAQDVALTGGTNQIVVTAFDEGGNTIEHNLVVVYSTEFENN